MKLIVVARYGNTDFYIAHDSSQNYYVFECPDELETDDVVLSNSVDNLEKTGTYQNSVKTLNSWNL